MASEKYLLLINFKNSCLITFVKKLILCYILVIVLIEKVDYINNFTSKRLTMMVVSTLIMGLGISLVILSNLGASAVTSFAYVLSLIGGLSFGTMTFIFNCLYIIAQKLILKNNFPTIQWGQIIISLFLGLAIDGWSWVLTALEPTSYILQLITLVLGCAIIGSATVIQLEYSPIYNPAEGIVLALSRHFNADFSHLKIIFDSSLVILAVIFSLIAFGFLNGVREGTIISSFLVGWFIGQFKKIKGAI